MRRALTVWWTRTLCTLLGGELVRLRGAAYDAGYADGYDDGLGDERADWIAQFTALERDAPPQLH